MGRLALALGYILTGDERLLREYNKSFTSIQPYQPPPSAEWLRFVASIRAKEAAKSKLGSDG